jgi:putative ATPase
MATAPKSNASYLAIEAAIRDVREGRTIPVPIHLRDSHYQGAQRLGHGKGYQYAHDFDGGYVAQDYLGVEKVYYEPTDRGFEAEIAQRLRRLRDLRDLRAASDSADANRAARPADRANPDASDVS